MQPQSKIVLLTFLGISGIFSVYGMSHAAHNMNYTTPHSSAHTGPVALDELIAFETVPAPGRTSKDTRPAQLNLSFLFQHSTLCPRSSWL